MVIRHKVDGGLGGKVYGVEGWDLREMGSRNGGGSKGGV